MISSSHSIHRLLSNPQSSKVLPKHAHLQTKHPLGLNQIGARPEARVNLGNEASIRRAEALGLSDTPGVAQNDILLLHLIGARAGGGPPEDRIGHVGDEIGAGELDCAVLVGGCCGMGECAHGEDGLEAGAVGADQREKVGGVAVGGEVIFRGEVGQLGHGFDGVAVGGLGQVGMITTAGGFGS